jgi:hypothetical protein
MSHFFDYTNLSTVGGIVVNFTQLSDTEGLPFPLYLHFVWKLILSISLLVVLIQGTRLRAIIVSCILSPETKIGSINYLIWVDELNGILLGVSIAIRILFLLSPHPVNTFLGNDFCKLAEFTASVYIGGASTWGCYIAFFRVLFIKTQAWLKDEIGEKTLLHLMLCVGTLLNFSGGAIFVLIDDKIITKKFCYHLSVNDFKIFEDYQVGPYNLVTENAMNVNFQ